MLWRKILLTIEVDYQPTTTETNQKEQIHQTVTPTQQCEVNENILASEHIKPNIVAPKVVQTKLNKNLNNTIEQQELTNTQLSNNQLSVETNNNIVVTEQKDKKKTVDIFTFSQFKPEDLKVQLKKVKKYREKHLKRINSKNVEKENLQINGNLNIMESTAELKVEETISQTDISKKHTNDQNTVKQDDNHIDSELLNSLRAQIHFLNERLAEQTSNTLENQNF